MTRRIYLDGVPINPDLRAKDMKATEKQVRYLLHLLAKSGYSTTWMNARFKSLGASMRERSGRVDEWLRSLSIAQASALIDHEPTCKTLPRGCRLPSHRREAFCFPVNPQSYHFSQASRTKFVSFSIPNLYSNAHTDRVNANNPQPDDANPYPSPLIARRPGAPGILPNHQAAHAQTQLPRTHRLDGVIL